MTQYDVKGLFNEPWLLKAGYNETECKVTIPFTIKQYAPRVGKEKALTNRQLREMLLQEHGIVAGEPRVRKIINMIRNRMIIPGLIGTSKGYYITDDPEEVQLWIDSLDGRVCAIMELIEKAKDYLHTLTNRRA